MIQVAYHQNIYQSLEGIGLESGGELRLVTWLGYRLLVVLNVIGFLGLVAIQKLVALDIWLLVATLTRLLIGIR